MSPGFRIWADLTHSPDLGPLQDSSVVPWETTSSALLLPSELSIWDVTES